MDRPASHRKGSLLSTQTKSPREYIKLELCGLNSEQANKAQKMILGLISEIGLPNSSHFIREREGKDGVFRPVFSSDNQSDDTGQNTSSCE